MLRILAMVEGKRGRVAALGQHAHAHRIFSSCAP